MDNKNKRILNDIQDLFISKKISCLVFSYIYRFGDNGADKYVCRIDCIENTDNVDYTYEGPLPTFYDETSNDYQNNISKSDICVVLHNLFDLYDLRCLNEAALKEHPSRYVPDYDEGYSYYSVRLDYTDGEYDEVRFERSSIAYNLVKAYIPHPSVLERLFY